VSPSTREIPKNGNKVERGGIKITPCAFARVTRAVIRSKHKRLTGSREA
jgi:hypothetical protein